MIEDVEKLLRGLDLMRPKPIHERAGLSAASLTGVSGLSNDSICSHTVPLKTIFNRSAKESFQQLVTTRAESAVMCAGSGTYGGWSFPNTVL